MAGQLDEAAKQILGTLLADFTDRGLTAQDLKKGYEGPNIEALATAVCSVADFTSVDFEVAFGDLEKAKMIKTGPMAMYDNDRNSSVIIIASYSKREFVYLTEAGYKESRKAPNRPQKVQRIVNNLTITGGQFTNTQLGQGETVSQSLNISTASDSEIVAKLVSILEAQGKPINSSQRGDIAAAVAAANEGDGKEAKSLLAKVCGPVWESVQPVMWPIVGELVKRSLGL
ncbi:hypothetical protein IM297_10165 [Enterobacter cloacae complex sp. I1]|uniref:hypothetical protein n=1 Tax=unclassified Enterobacter cloacae complex TaxID=2757714 RepID=UPI00186879FF|nr:MULTISPECIES: hypothetical protein [unclassified Enterobacter cloacae complex]MBE3465419.1 hypothetical protein [Enterobacter cloacae complex sp. P20C]MBE3473711.1 hypothetical protein [Enterobacter cloacae complex sp. P20B]MBE3495499.1 hypothetical protein [Enterobacter cloacae complex sp. P17RS]MBE3509824.1 hypothetical protein [Enterobacter cloacae complex sp. I10]MBE3528375.1 hypothetical protein [Enterobacter cloacae complex sp. I9]